MEGIILKRFCRRIFWGALILFVLVSPSFSQSPAESADTLTVKRIEVTESTEGSRVTIEASKPFEYTVFKLVNPLRVVVDLPEAQLGKLAGPIEVKNGTVNVIRNRQIEDPKRRGARVEIGLDKLVEYNVDSDGNFLYVNLGKPPLDLTGERRVPEEKKAEVKEEKPKITEAKAQEPSGEKPEAKAKAVKEVVVSAKPDVVRVDIKGDGQMPDFRQFQMARPPRLVVDLPGMKNASSKSNIDVDNKLLKSIRIGRHPDKVRLVFTFQGVKAPVYEIAKKEEELVFLIGRPKEEGAKEEKAQVAEVKRAIQPVPAETKPAEKPPEVTPAPAEKASPQEKEPPKEARGPEVDRSQITPYKGARLSLDFKDADIHNIFRLIAEVSDLNIITSDEVKGKVTVRLVNVPWDQALDVILSTKNLIKMEEGNVIRITTIENVRKEREDKNKEEEVLLKTRDTKIKLEEPGKKILKVNYADASELQKLLLEKKEEGKGFLSPQGSVKADKRTNTLIIQDIRSNLDEVEQLIKDLDSPTPQVLIEARIVQAQTTFVRSLGVQWGGSINQTGGGQWFWGLTGNSSAAAGFGFAPSASGGAASTPLIAPSNFVVNYPAPTANTPTGGLGLSFGKLTGNLVNLDLRLQLGETDGQTKVIARPKLATLDNKEALIKQGEKIPYETTSQAGTQVQFIDAVLSLKVTPHVTPDGSILMKVIITRDARGNFRSPINQVPSIDNREASTEVLVKDGETLVIGGIYESESAQTEQGIPWLMKIPILGWLFKNQEMRSSKNELLIFITPTIIQAKAES